MAGGCSWALPSRRSDIPRTPAVVIGAWIFPVVNGRSSRGSSVAASDAAMTGEHIPWGRIETSAERVLIIGAGPSLGEVKKSAIVHAREGGAHIIVVNAAIIAARCAQDWFSLDFDERTRALSKKCEDKTRVIAAVPDDFGTSDARIPQHRCTLPEGVLYLRRIEGSGALKPRGLEHLNELFATAVPQIEDRGVEVRIGNPHSRVRCFPRLPASEVLDWISTD